MKIENLKNIFDNESGQATVELAVMFPILLIVALISINALTFISECSKFDRDLKTCVACLGTSPSYGQDINNIVADIRDDLGNNFDNNFLELEVDCHTISGGYYSVCGQLYMTPTLFGLGLRDNVLGVALPKLTHKQQINIEVYKPGVLF